MELPKTIKVGSRIYKVGYKKRLMAGDGVTRLNGKVNHNKHKIRLDPDRSNSAMREVLLHEVIHACFDFAGLEADETWTVRLAPVLSAVLADNPELLDLWK